MIAKQLTEITEADLRSLISNEIPEGKSLDYKRDLLGSSKEAGAEFVADVVSFANTSGGDLVYGITEVAGVASELVGVDIENVDALALQLQNICRDNTDHQIPSLQLQAIPLPGGRYIYIVRIAQSWQQPHRSTRDRHFYARNSNGKYPMDTT